MNDLSRPIIEPLEKLLAVGREIADAYTETEVAEILINAVVGLDTERLVLPVPVDCAVIATVTQDGRQFTVVAAHNCSPQAFLNLELIRTSTPESFMQHFKSRDWLVFNSNANSNVVDAVNGHNNGHEKYVGVSIEPCSGVILPIYLHDQLLGVLMVGSFHVQDYPKETLSILCFIAQQNALVLTNIRSQEVHVKALEALLHEFDLFEAMFETTNDALLMIGKDRTVITVNVQFEKFFNIPRHLLNNRKIDDLASLFERRPDLPQKFFNMLLAYTGDTYQVAGGDFEMNSQQYRVLVWYSAPVHSTQSVSIGRLFMFRDVTHEREVDRMKTEFVSLVSHELRTPLTSIKGFTDFILDGDAGEVSDLVLKYLNIIQINADRLITLINDILEITRLDAGKLGLKLNFHTVKSLFDPLELTFQPMLAARKQQLIITYTPDLPELWIDRDRIIQVLTNLLTNASKYSTEGKTLRLEARLLTPDDPPIEGKDLSVTERCILMAVQDQGMGIAEKDLPYLFTRFYRTDAVTKSGIAGTGLGLSIARSFVELHHGEIWVHSEQGVGSTFYFTLPLVENRGQKTEDQ